MWRSEWHSRHIGDAICSRGCVSIGVFDFTFCKLRLIVQQKKGLWTSFLLLYKENKNTEKLNKTKKLFRILCILRKTFYSTPRGRIFVMKLLIKASVGKVFPPATLWLLMQKGSLVVMLFCNLKKNPLKFYWVYFITFCIWQIIIFVFKCFLCVLYWQLIKCDVVFFWLNTFG